MLSKAFDQLDQDISSNLKQKQNENYKKNLNKQEIKTETFWIYSNLQQRK